MNVSSFGPLTIRPALEEDVPLILSFVTKLAEYENLADKVTATEQGLREGLFGAAKRAEAAIAYAGDTPAGCAVFFPSFSTYTGRSGIYLEDLFVEAEYRSQGVGKALLTYLEGVARERGCPWLQWVVLKWNQPAIDFYKARGAEPLDDWTLYRKRVEPVARPVL